MVLFPIISGLVASSLHVLSGPDHLAAVTPLVVQSNKNAWRVGFSWGLGHVTGMMIIGVLVYFFKEAIPFELISGYSEKLVGLILIIIGLWVISRFLKNMNGKKTIQVQVARSHRHIRKINDFSFGIGVVHGLAGISHLILLLPVLSFNSNSDSIIYLVGFCLGSIVSMIVYTTVLRLITSKANNKNHPLISNGIQVTAGIFALIVGCFWMVQTV